MQLLTGKNDEKAIHVAQYGHDLFLDMKSLRDETVKNIGLTNEQAELALETLDNFLEELLEEKQQKNSINNIGQIRENKNSILGGLLRSITEATINQSIADALQLDDVKLAGSEPYIVNGVDMTITGSVTNQKARDELIDNIESTFKEIDIPSVSLNALVTDLENAKSPKAFMEVIQSKILSGKLHQDIYNRLLPERENINSEENNLTNTSTMRPA